MILANEHEFGYKSVQDVVSVHDFHATLLHTMGVDIARCISRMKAARRA